MNVPYAVASPAVLGELQRLVEVVEQLDDRALLVSSRCFGWTRADLLAHVHLALHDMLVDPTDAKPDTDAASYWRAEPPSNDPESDELDNLRFARLLASAYRRPTGLIGHLRPTIDAVVRAVGQLSAPAVNFRRTRADQWRLPGDLGHRAGCTSPRPRSGPGCPWSRSGGPPAGPADRRCPG